MITDSDNDGAGKMNIDRMIRRDMPEVMAIEKDCFEFPWSESYFIEQLRRRNVIGMVAKNSDDQVVGFMVYELNKNDLQIINIAVHSGFRRTKVGTEMLDKLKTKLSQQRRRKITADVRESNYAAQLWLKSCCFVCVEQFKDFYEDIEEDGYRFQFEKFPTVRQSMNNRVGQISR